MAETPDSDPGSGPTLASLCHLATAIIGSPCHFAHDTHRQPLSGGEHTVYVLESFLRQQKIAIRIPKNRTGPHTGFLSEQEAEFRRRIDTVAVNLFQPLFDFSNTAENALKTPFLALSWVDGSPLKWSADHPAAEHERQHVLHAVANATLDLLQVNAPGSSALTWIKAKIDRKMDRARKGNLPGATVAECERQIELTDKYWAQELDAAPHVLVHGDLSRNNIIVDDKNNAVRGIIDLGWAEMVPLQFAASYPRFLTNEPDREAGFNAIVGLLAEQMQRDREFYLNCIKDRAWGTEGTACCKITIEFWMRSRGTGGSLPLVASTLITP